MKPGYCEFCKDVNPYNCHHWAEIMYEYNPPKEHGMYKDTKAPETCKIRGLDINSNHCNHTLKPYTFVEKKLYMQIKKDSDKTQIGGDHYLKLKIQPWEIIEANGLGFWDGNIIKYILRYKEKGGLQDLEKAKHYLDKLLELHSKLEQEERKAQLLKQKELVDKELAKLK